MIETESEPTHEDRARSRERLLDWTEAGLWIVLLVVGSLVAMAAALSSTATSLFSSFWHSIEAATSPCNLARVMVVSLDRRALLNRS